MELRINNKIINVENFKLKVKYILEIEKKGYNYFELLSNVENNKFQFTPMVEILAIFLKDYGVDKSDLMEIDFDTLQEIMIAFFGSDEETTEKSGE